MSVANYERPSVCIPFRTLHAFKMHRMQILMELNHVSKSHHYLPNDTIEHVFEIVSLQYWELTFAPFLRALWHNALKTKYDFIFSLVWNHQYSGFAVIFHLIPTFLSFSANKMQKQVEVRMGESHMEPIVETPDSICGSMCDKIMKNMVLTLTILGTCIWSAIYINTLSYVWCLSQHVEIRQDVHSGWVVRPSLH